MTANAYDWYRKLRKFGDGVHGRVHLIKGEANKPDAPRTRISYPDAQKKDNKALSRGDVPVLMLNVNLLKDELNNLLERSDEESQITWPDWLPDEWFSEMCAERRTPTGWEKPSGQRNEAWDLATYLLGILRHKKIDRLNWVTPPDWAAAPRPESRNPFYTQYTVDPKALVVTPPAGRYKTLADLGEKLA